MADPYHHAVSSSKKWGGTPEDYIDIHQWFDASKAHACDMRHRALRHHSEGIMQAVQIFGHIRTVSTGRRVPVRWIGEQHVKEDFGFIPSFVDWMRAIKAEPWMNKPQKLTHIDDTPITL